MIDLGLDGKRALVTGAGIGIDEIRLHRDPLRRQLSLDELPPRKLADGEVPVHAPGPGPPHAVQGEHRRDRSACAIPLMSPSSAG